MSAVAIIDVSGAKTMWNALQKCMASLVLAQSLAHNPHAAEALSHFALLGHLPEHVNV
jgi:hypothetical protein